MFENSSYVAKLEGQIEFLAGPVIPGAFSTLHVDWEMAGQFIISTLDNRGPKEVV